MNSSSNVRRLYQLAHNYGVQTAYYDVSHRRQPASRQALVAVLQALGAPVASVQDVASAWRERRQALWRRSLEPVVVAWNGGPLNLKVRLKDEMAEATLGGRLRLENGECQDLELPGANAPVVETAEIDGTRYVVRQFPLPDGLPWGYHRLTLEFPGRSEEALIISAPNQAYAPPLELEVRKWGVFLPLYALHSEQSGGGGNLTDLANLIVWVAGMGGQVVATLPLLATFPDEVLTPSPYLPVSRLMWNEFYLDITKSPDWPDCHKAKAIWASSQSQKEIKALSNLPLVDYRRQMALKRPVLEELVRCCFKDKSKSLEALHHFAEANPMVEDYARFRATVEKRGESWQLWPPPPSDGLLREGDFNEENRRYHLYVQWLAHEQINSISEEARENGVQLYLDLPLGVHPDGYDVWRWRRIFALEATAGAPPDAVFTSGQNWLFPPLHPERVREEGYQYLASCLRHHLRYASILRIDHVMGLHRLFWVPKGFDASHGVYVRYKADELYAILALESHRQRAVVVGEDLGTVSPEVRPTMNRHGLHRMYVVQYELASNRRPTLPAVPRDSVASLNTHDMFPFAAFWQGQDIEERQQFGLLNRLSAKRERKSRQAVRETLLTFLHKRGWLKWPQVDTGSVLNAGLAFLGASRAQNVLVNLEDLWRETNPQNVPSTRQKYPNWRHKARYRLEEFCQMSSIVDTLKQINRLRKLGGQ